MIFFAFLPADRAYSASAEPICSTPAAIFCEDFENVVLPGIWEDGYNPSLHGTKGAEPLQDVGERRHHHIDLLGHRLDGFLEIVDVRRDLGDDER